MVVFYIAKNLIQIIQQAKEKKTFFLKKLFLLKLGMNYSGISYCFHLNDFKMI